MVRNLTRWLSPTHYNPKVPIGREPDSVPLSLCIRLSSPNISVAGGCCTVQMLRAHFGLLADIGQRLLQNVTFRCQRVQCLRVGNTMIPDRKRIETALQHIHGIGRRRAHQILSQLGIGNRPTMDLTATEIILLKEEVSKYLTAGDLKRVVDGDIKKLADIQCYRGYRHACMLPCRGQRTKTNARTMKEHNRRDKGNWERSRALAENMEKFQQREQGK